MQTTNNKKERFSFKKWLSTKQGTAVLSVVIAVLIWFMVVTIIEPGSTKSFFVPVDYTFNEAAYTSQGLSIIETALTSVEVEVQGDGTVLAGLTENDILVYPDYASIKGVGDYTLRLVVRNAGTKQFEILDDDLGFVDLTFDKFIESTFNIAVNVTGVETAEGYYMDVPAVSPQTVTLTGPEKSIDKISSVVANVSLEEQREESAIVTSRLTYLDEAGETVDISGITADIEQVEVTVPIYRIKELPLTVEFTGVPSGFDPAVLGTTLSSKTIRIAGPSSQIDSLQSISAGIIDLATFNLEDELVLHIELPENVKNVDNLQTVRVNFTGTVGFDTKEVTVTEIQTRNVPDGIEVSFPSEQVNHVILVGLASELEELTDTSVVAVVDFSPTNLGVSSGQQNIPVQITVTSGETIFATGSYTIICEIKPSEQSTSSSAVGADDSSSSGDSSTSDDSDSSSEGDENDNG